MSERTRSGDDWVMVWLPDGRVVRQRLRSGKTRHMGIARTEAEFDAMVNEYVALREASSRHRSCPTGKFIFWTEEEAITALARALLSRSEKRQEQRRYDCTEGGTALHWHLTSLNVWVG